MDINCGKCDQKYHIPDYRIDDKRLFFICEKCGHKIVIERKKDPWFSFRPLTSESPSACDILDGIFLSFNRKSFLMSFVFLAVIGAVISLFTFISMENREFFISNSLFYFICSFFVSMIAIFAFDLNLYLVSKNFIHIIKNESDIKLKHANGEIKNDIKTVFIFSAGILSLIMLLLVPLLPLKSYGAVYAGVMFPLIYIFVVISAVLFVFKNFIYAIVASRSRSFSVTARSILKFIIVENINLPLYMVIIKFIFIFFSAVVLFFAALPMLICASVAGFATGSFSGLNSLQAMSVKLFSDGGYSSYGKFGLVLFVLFSVLILVSAAAYLVNLAQALFVSAYCIIESNPGRSVNRWVSIGAVIFILSLAALPLMFLLRLPVK